MGQYEIYVFVGMVMAVTLLCLGVVLWNHRKLQMLERASVDQDGQLVRWTGSFFYWRWLAGTSIIMLLMGGQLVYWAGSVAENEMKSKLLLRTMTAAATISAEQVAVLKGDSSDIETSEYGELKGRLEAAKKFNADCRFIYIMRKVDNHIVFLVDSEDPASKDYSEPGSLFNEASPGLYQLFEQGENILEGPVADAWGIWVSGLAAVRDPGTGRIIAVIGMDVDAGNWVGMIRSVEIVVASVLFMFYLVFVAALMIIRVTRLSAKHILELENSLRLAAETANETKSRFVAHVSHELRTPIHGIMGLTELLGETSLDNGQQEYVRMISRSSRNLLTIVNDILDLSKIEAGFMELHNRNFLLWPIFEDIKAFFSVQAARKNLEFIIQWDQEIPETLHGDPDRLRQVLANLLGNALKFTAEGRIVLQVALKRKLAGGVNIEFQIQDTGVGMTLEEQAQLCQPFFQGNSARILANESGTGLGLTISRYFIEKMGGGFQVESQLNQGTKCIFDMYLSWPVSGQKTERNIGVDYFAGVQPEERISEIVREALKQADDCDILVVEDNRVNQNLVLLQLKKLGYKAGLAENGKKALDALKASNCRLILMDCKMPEMDGLEATRRIRAAGNSIPIVAMTAGLIENERQDCLAQGMSDCLTKPVDVETLRQMLHRWLPEKKKDGVTAESGDLEGALPSSVEEAMRALQALAKDAGVDVGIFIDAYIQDMPRMMEELGQGVCQMEYSLIAERAHAMKSMNRTMGAKVLAEILQDMENAAKEENAGSIPNFFAKVKLETEKLMEELLSWQDLMESK